MTAKEFIEGKDNGNGEYIKHGIVPTWLIELMEEYHQEKVKEYDLLHNVSKCNHFADEWYTSRDDGKIYCRCGEKM